MAQRQRRRADRQERPAGDRVEPSIYLPEANPPRKSLPQLIVAAVLFALWLAILLFLVLR